MTNPRIFVGSSTEGLDVAYAIQENLEFDAEPTVWSQGIFAPGIATLQALIAKLREFEFAVFVFTADDEIKLRGTSQPAVRDNLIFELGLFMGALGQERCFFVLPRGVSKLRMPTDLLGITHLGFDQSRSDGNLVAALGPACNQIRRELRKVRTELSPEAARIKKIESFKAVWAGAVITHARDRLRLGVVSQYDPDYPDSAAALKRLFAFFESLSDAVLAGDVAEAEARQHFGASLTAFWPTAFIHLAPPNHADDFWEPEPRIAQLYQKWRKT